MARIPEIGEEIIILSKQIHVFSHKVAFLPPKSVTNEKKQRLMESSEILRRRVLNLRRRVRRTPARTYEFKKEDLKGVDFFFFSWRTGKELASGRDFVYHPFIDLTTIDALSLLTDILKRQEELIEEKITKESILVITIKQFKYMIKQKWNYILELETPETWDSNRGAATGNITYAVKYRSIIFVESFRLAKTYFDKPAWRNLTQTEISNYHERGVPLPKRLRTMLRDPSNAIQVTEIESDKHGRRLWRINFSAYAMSFVQGASVDIKSLIERTRRLKYKANTINI